MGDFLNFIQQILSTPSLLVGAIALIGLISQGKAIEDVIKGTIKTILGFIVIGSGAGILVGALNYFGELFNFAFGVQGVVPNNEAIVSLALNDYASSTALIMAFGMFANIIIARFSRLKYIFLTGHHTLYMAALIAVVLTVGGLKGWQLILSGSCVLGFTMVFFPALAQKTMEKITGDDSIAFAHFGTLGYVFSAWLGSKFGNKSKSTEDIKFPKRLSFMRDTSVAIALTMFLFFMIVTFIATTHADFDPAMIGGNNWFLFSIIQALTFAGGVYIVLAGVRLLIAEIVPAFKGFSEKIVPDAKPALDCPIVFPFAENAVLLGFLVSFAGGLAGLSILVLMGGSLALILPGVIPHFFCGATAGVFGNATGGRRGAILGAFGHGLLITFLPAFLMPVLGSLGFANTTFSDADFTAVGIVLGNIARVMQGYGLMAICIALPMIPILYNIFYPQKSNTPAANKGC
ncbi:PTS system IIC component, L-Asc family (TC 4.A.7) [Geosporobacter subterraneus DSM 17957]|uniref:Ascorbate-specific PTS system EIIC component n=1 Tax=Geosporobacter subterraneus DSM 17957 TaxID=1121919 RepID=A0A1M6EFQ8_9FIRM|nr:PTS ascorbate transporter subunit IIC [Geosporobacter subterraneus]SHI84312.1 PTS system IIC component, L-Asc family (TC 4.A.7) [Geosporobacter subterraneus DSM 17957]